MIRVYLAGGLKTDWQQNVIDAFADDREVEFLDPREVSPDGGGMLFLAAQVEREWLDRADIVFGYVEVANTVPIGLAAEFGYIAGKRRAMTGSAPTLILVNQLETRGMEWVAFFVQPDQYTTSLGRGLDLLRHAVEAHRPHQRKAA